MVNSTGPTCIHCGGSIYLDSGEGEWTHNPRNPANPSHIRCFPKRAGSPVARPRVRP